MRETTAVFSFFTDIARFITYIVCNIFFGFINFLVTDSEMKNSFKEIVLERSSDMMFHILCCCARDQFYCNTRFNSFAKSPSVNIYIFESQITSVLFLLLPPWFCDVWFALLFPFVYIITFVDFFPSLQLIA